MLWLLFSVLVIPRSQWFISTDDTFGTKLYSRVTGTCCRPPASKWINKNNDPALHLLSEGEGMYPYYCWWEITPLSVWDTWKSHVWRSRGVRFSSSKGVVGRESSCSKGIHLIRVNMSTFFTTDFSVNFSVKFHMFTNMRDKDFLRILRDGWVPSQPTYLIRPQNKANFVFSSSQRIIPLKFLRCLLKDIKTGKQWNKKSSGREERWGTDKALLKSPAIAAYIQIFCYVGQWEFSYMFWSKCKGTWKCLWRFLRTV